MAIITCPECGREISDTSRECPFCGFSIYKQKMKKYVMIFGLIGCIIVISVFTGYKLIERNQQIDKYNTAISLQREKQYDQAEKLFLELGDFKDSKEQIKRISQKYDTAISLKNEKKYNDAEKLFLELENYKDSQDNIKQLNKEYVEQIAEISGTVYGLGISSWMASAVYSDASVKYNKIEASLFVNNFMSNSEVLETLSLIKDELMQMEKDFAVLQNAPSKYVSAYVHIQQMFDDAKKLYNIIENPMMYYSSYSIKMNTLYTSLNDTEKLLTDYMKMCDYYDDFDSIFQKSLADIIDGVNSALVISNDAKIYSSSNSQYLFDSDTKYITTEYLQTKTKDEISLILNEIYARHGYIFIMDKYKQYFSNQSWYSPKYTSEQDAEKYFNDIEKENKKRIVDYELAKGWR